MNKITVVCHKDHSHGYEDFEGKCLLCVIDAMMLEIANLMVQNQNFAPPTDFISPSVVKAISNCKWVGLTDEEIYDYADKFLYQHGSNYGIKSFGKAIEAKLKEKNA